MTVGTLAGLVSYCLLTFDSLTVDSLTFVLYVVQWFCKHIHTSLFSSLDSIEIERAIREPKLYTNYWALSDI